MTPSERLNCDCNKLAGNALSDALEHGRYIDRVLPDEDLVVLLDGIKVSGLYMKRQLHGTGVTKRL
jgi:hypothetical protein